MTVETELMVADDSPCSIGKAVRVLRSLAQARGDADGVTHIAAVANLPKSTTHRILSVFIEEGLVCRSGQRYRLGPGWFELQSPLKSSAWQHLVKQAKLPLAQLFERTEATVHLAVLDGDDVLYLEKLTARGGTSIATRVGDRKPALCTALGKSLVAYGDFAKVHSMLTRPLPVSSRRSIRGPGILANQLQQTRRSGLAYDFEEAQPGVFCVAAPVFSGSHPVAAVSVTRFGSVATSRADADAVRHAARQISAWVDASS